MAGSVCFVTLSIRSTDDGIVLDVKVKPRSRRRGILGIRAGSLLIGVSSAPERGKANQELVQILAALLGRPRSSIEILSGHNRRDKVVRCSGANEAEARRLLGD